MLTMTDEEHRERGNDKRLFFDDCLFCDGIQCDPNERHCNTCGWNPAVRERRQAKKPVRCKPIHRAGPKNGEIDDIDKYSTSSAGKQDGKMKKKKFNPRKRPVNAAGG